MGERPKWSCAFLLPVMFMTLLLAAGCAKKQPANYYRHVDLDGRCAIVGRYPVADEEAAGINCYHFVRDDDGRLVKVEYLVGGKLKEDDFFGAAQVVIEYSDGQEKRTYLNAGGQPAADKKGVYSRRLKFDENGSPVSLSNYDAAGKLVEDYGGVAVVRFKNDEAGNIIEERYFGDDDKEAIISDVASRRWKYDDRGNKIEGRLIDAEKQLTEPGIFVEAVQLVFDEEEEKYTMTWSIVDPPAEKYKLNPIRRGITDELEFKKYIRTDEQLSERNFLGNAVVRWKYDEQGNRIEARYFDADEKLKEGSLLIPGIVRFKYDERGNLVEESYHGADGNSKEDVLGVAVRRRKYDERGNKVEVRHFGADGRLKEDSCGIAVVRCQYDGRGNVVEERYFGTDERLKEDKITAVAVVRYKYDERGNKKEGSYYGADEKLKGTNISGGVAFRRWKYDEAGNTVEVKFYDADEKLTENLKIDIPYVGYAAVIRIERDEQGRNVRKLYTAGGGSRTYAVAHPPYWQ